MPNEEYEEFRAFMAETPVPKHEESVPDPKSFA
jgi:hypothetical protein